LEHLIIVINILEDKMKKIIILSVLLALSLFSFNCGGGSGSSNSPKGENPGEPSVVQLLPSQFIAQTNSSITLHAKVLDGNGAPVNNIPVSFTNLSPTGVLSALSAKTNGSGLASVTIKSTTAGFSTVQAEINQGVAQVRDRKTVFFSSFNASQAIPTLELTASNYTLFQTTNDNEVTVTATVFDGFGQRVVGMYVLFGSDSEEATFPLGSTVMTDSNGQASVLVKVIPSTLRSLPTVINVTALAYNGAFNIVSLTLNPVTIQKVDVFANPLSVDSGGSSTVTAQVTTSAGTPAPDGTTVNFTADIGGIDTFGQTTNGVAEATFNAPTLKAGASDETALITASSGGKSDTVNVTIIAPEPEPIEDTTSPTVTSTNPASNGTLDISDAGGNPVPVTIVFSENIDCSTVTPTTVTITPITGVNWTLASCSGPNVVFKGTLTGGSLPGTAYTVNVGTGVKDLAGNVAVAYIFSFSAVD
jgi:Bacterial Ig-like domain (group 1)/Bacterial Ig-like domain